MIGAQADAFEQFGHAPSGLVTAEAEVGGMEHDRLLDLCADAAHRVQRVQRALEHDRGTGPAHGSEAARPHRVDILVAEQHRSFDQGLLRQQSQNRPGDRRLAAARLAGEADRLAALDREIDAAHRRHVAVFGTVGDAQVDQLEETHRLPAFRSRRRGSRISSRARPNNVNASTTATIPRPAGR